MSLDKEFMDALEDLWPLFALSCGIAFLCGKGRLKNSYKGRSFGSCLLSDIISAVSTGVLAVSGAVVMSLVWPELADVKTQICAIGLMSGYGLNFINRLIEKKLGLSTVDVDDHTDIISARQHKRKKTNGNKKEDDNSGAGDRGAGASSS